jgi:hypothetical protein
MKLAYWQRTGLLACTLLAVAPVKCNSIFAKREALPDEYEYVQVTGSTMRVKVKKGSSEVTGSPVGVMEGEQARNFIKSTQQGMKTPGLPGN